MRDQLSNRPFSTWLTYSPIFIFLFFPSSDLDFLAKIFVKQKIKLVWPNNEIFQKLQFYLHAQKSCALQNRGMALTEALVCVVRDLDARSRHIKNARKMPTVF